MNVDSRLFERLEWMRNQIVIEHDEEMIGEYAIPNCDIWVQREKSSSNNNKNN